MRLNMYAEEKALPDGSGGAFAVSEDKIKTVSHN